MTSEHRTPAEIERDIEINRRNLTSNIEGLQEKISVNGIFQQISDQLRTNSGEIGRSFYNQVRANPLPVVLTGVGLIWMMASDSSSARKASDVSSRNRDRSRDFDDDTSVGFRPVGDDQRVVTGRSAYAADRAHDQGQPSWAKGTLLGGGSSGRSGEGMASRMADTARDRASAVSDTMSSAGSAISDGVHSVADAISRFGHQIAEGTEHLSEEGKARVINARRRALEMRQSLPSVSDGAEMTADYYERQPLVFGAIAAAIGAAIGGALPRTRTEDSLMGEHSDDLYHEAERILSEERRKAERVASATMSEVKDVISDTADEVTGKLKGEAAPGATKTSLGRVVDAARTSAEKEGLGKPNA